MGYHDVEWGALKRTDTVVEACPLFFIEATTLDLLPIDLTDVGEETLDELYGTHFEVEECAGILLSTPYTLP